jgi:choline dehydrogenase
MESYDYIVVGAGTSGCVVAGRLSESGRHRVLVLETGGSDNTFWIRVPIGYGRTFVDPRVNWMYETEPDPATLNRKAYWPRGKVLGGSGSINALVYMRGLAQDYDDWARAGNPGWGWDDVLPYFKKLEDHCGGASAVHGAGGPIRITDVSRFCHPLVQRYLDAAKALGIRETADFNGEQQEGVGIYQILTRNGFRESTSFAYLHPARKRANVTLRTNCHVLRLTFEGTRATGVVYRDAAGREVTATAARSVVLSGGAINSPQLLQLSGVGPRALLGKHGIPLVKDAPAVGQNLQDHLNISYFYRSKVRTLNNELYPWYGKLWAGIRYVLTRSGPLSMSVNQGGGFVRSDLNQTVPNLQLYFNPASYTTSPGDTRKLMNPDPFAAFLLSFNSCRPTSRGHLEIRSRDPLVHPAIHPNYLSTDKDIEEAMGGMRLLRKLAATRPLADVIEEEMIPGPSKQSDDELLADFRQRAGTVYHPTCTCRMGPDPKESVVDARLRVHGLDGLRVIDASVFPYVTSGNTNAPSIMVGEKGAAMLQEDTGA